ncbi:PREDICTED: FBD-associated F-box protein At5g38590-like [Camelina sativa]|uniref:FBD-associated F-box protein At5g38590-like n=1 Tax=Camelina sativa TaxID=90675 RepID=A0ABM1QL54_CAMSA|nr:PREDICTED: FBD-associated F-box protein At5g38590-like [Camelina sativa]
MLVKILSFLPTKEAVSTCVLSNRWEFLWMWLSKLEFNSQSDPRPGLGDFLDKKLPLHRAPVIESLCYHVTCNSHIKPKNVKQWIEITISRCVRELEIDYYPNGEKVFIFLSSLFTCKSLVTLKLQHINHTDVPYMVCFHALKTLQLDAVSFVDGTSLQDMVATTLVCDKYSIKYLKLEDWNEEEHYCLIKNMPKLREAYVVSLNPKSLMGSITFVKRLTICSEPIPTTWTLSLSLLPVATAPVVGNALIPPPTPSSDQSPSTSSPAVDLNPASSSSSSPQPSRGVKWSVHRPSG